MQIEEALQAFLAVYCMLDRVRPLIDRVSSL
jgi:hypothetical protein